MNGDHWLARALQAVFLPPEQDDPFALLRETAERMDEREHTVATALRELMGKLP